MTAEPVPAEEAASSEGSGEPGTTPDTRWRLGNRPALTGIRAPLMATVLIFHSNFQTLPGSWASLGMFFVLSGFLITAMLAGEHQSTGRISLSQFYARRGVRLLPPLFITVALLAIYAGLVYVRSAADTVWGDVTGAVFYFADYRSAFGHESPFGFLAQTWSLAVEEQFYLVWAILFFVALRYGTRRIAYCLAAIGLVASVVDRTWIVLHAAHWNSYVAGRVYYAFDTRADALFLGCLLGLVATGGHLDGWTPGVRRILSLLAAAATATLIWIIFNVTLSARSLPLVWLPVSEVAALVIIVYLLIRPEGVSARVLALPFIVVLGNMTYAVYLFHWPVYVAISPYSVHWPFWLEETVRVAIIMALAVASWYLVERPLMRWRRRALAPRPTEDRAAVLGDAVRAAEPGTDPNPPVDGTGAREGSVPRPVGADI